MMDKVTANYIYENTTGSTFDLDLQGIWLNDREILMKFDLASCSYLAEHSRDRLGRWSQSNPSSRLCT
jgi:hypothetical protein